ncbi:MAG: isoprenoid biosynthesis glyoxalase ElbB [Chlamydiota bacterium]
MGKVALILSGCGYLDGSEIHESVLCMLHLARYHHEVQCFAPDNHQVKIMNHLTQHQDNGASRNALIEAARIARGHILSLEKLKVEDFDACLMPGGMGSILQFSDFEQKGVDCTVDPKLKEIFMAFYQAKKPIGATCIAPIILAKIFEGIVSIKMTLGSSSFYQNILNQLGMKGEIAKASDCVMDKEHLVYTTPCYMEPENLVSLSIGIENLIKNFLNG